MNSKYAGFEGQVLSYRDVKNDHSDSAIQLPDEMENSARLRRAVVLLLAAAAGLIGVAVAPSFGALAVMLWLTTVRRRMGRQENEAGS